MKKIKKLSAILLSLVIVLAMSAPAFATGEETPSTPDYSITVENAKAGETYTAYKMLDLSVDDPANPSAYRYTVNSAWSEFAKTTEFTNVFTVDDQGYISSTATSETLWTADGKVSILAEKAAAFAKTNNIASAGSVKIESGQTTGKINLTEAGYYVIASTMGSRAMIATTPDQSAVKINEKNDTDTVLKLVREDSTGSFDSNNNDAQIGDTVEFRTILTVSPRSVNVKLHDTMDSGLTFDPGSVKVYTTYLGYNNPGNVEYKGSYTLRYAAPDKEAPDSGDTFTIDFGDDLAATLTSANNYAVTYSATLNKNAVQAEAGTSAFKIVDQINRTTVSYGNGQKSQENTTTTTTHKAEVFKYYLDKTDPSNPQKKPLAGSVFELKKDGVHVNLVKLDNKNYCVADGDGTEAGTVQSHVGDDDTVNVIDVGDSTGVLVNDFISVDSGNIVIWGLDSDTDYTITERLTPAGYNRLTASVPLIYNQATETTPVAGFALTEVLNQTGTELPNTGGIGTTVFYIAGGILVLCAAVFFVVRRKMNKEESV